MRANLKPYLDAALILASFLLVFIWQATSFSAFSVPVVGFLVFIFLLVSMRNKKSMNFGGSGSFLFINTVLLLLVFSTGGITSNLFFILYFLLFGSAFIMDPRSVFAYPVGILIIFWPHLFAGDVTENLIKVGGVILLSPLAYLFGQQFKHSDAQLDEVLATKERGADAADEIAKDVEDLLHQSKSELNEKEVQKLNEILEETEDLRAERNG
jgi:hypothetical protein